MINNGGNKAKNNNISNNINFKVFKINFYLNQPSSLLAKYRLSSS